MTNWNETIWGVLILGAIGSIIGSILLRVLKKPCAKLAIKFFSRLLSEYKENKLFVEKCEDRKRLELIIIKYNSAMQRFTRIQITLHCANGYMFYGMGHLQFIRKVIHILPTNIYSNANSKFLLFYRSIYSGNRMFS